MAEPPCVAVLAAGRGTRFGGNKLEAPCAGKPLGRWALDAVAGAGLEPGMLVTGPEGASFADGWTKVINPDPGSGLGSSLALAARLALAGGRKKLLVLLADMPLVTPEYLCALAATPAPAATRQAGGRAGVPALLGHALLKKAAALTGDRGAGPLLARARLLDPPPGMLRDVDTPEDLAEAERRLTANRPPPSASRTPPP
jgi:CTP:molybdopterin cytidylyltransferase MocA